MKARHAKPNFGFTTIDFILVIVALAGILLVILPTWARSRRGRVARVSCTSNLKQIGLAFRIWAGDNEDKFPAQVSITNGGAMEIAMQGSPYEVFLVMSNELNTPKILLCPDDLNQKRAAAVVFAGWNAPNSKTTVTSFPATNTLSYFVGLEADDTKPVTILSGDDHFSIAGAKPSRGLLSLSTNTSVEWRKERHPKQGNIALAD